MKIVLSILSLLSTCSNLTAYTLILIGITKKINLENDRNIVVIPEKSYVYFILANLFSLAGSIIKQELFWIFNLIMIFVFFYLYLIVRKQNKKLVFENNISN